jgi:hypothetical protein
VSVEVLERMFAAFEAVEAFADLESAREAAS